MKIQIPLTLLAAAMCAVPAPLAATPSAEAWEIGPSVRGRNYSVGMPLQPGAAPNGLPTFAFPQDGEVDAMTTAIGPLAGARQITFRYRIDAVPGARFVPVESPDQPATVSLYFQQAGDNWSARGRYASYRWYAPREAVIPITPGEHTVTVKLDDVWTNVHGVPNTEDPRGYSHALTNTARLGIAFGTSSARSHGVRATGAARFTLLGLSVS